MCPNPIGESLTGCPCVKDDTPVAANVAYDLYPKFVFEEVLRITYIPREWLTDLKEA